MGLLRPVAAVLCSRDVSCNVWWVEALGQPSGSPAQVRAGRGPSPQSCSLERAVSLSLSGFNSLC